MKQIINIDNNLLIECSPSKIKFYGIRNNGIKGFITLNKDNDHKFTCIAAKNITIGETWNKWDNISLVGIISHLIYDNIDVIEFKTARTLFYWLAA